MAEPEGRSIKPLFIDAPSPTARFITCVILSFLLISIDHRHQHLAAIRAVLAVAVYPIQYAVTLPVKLVDGLAENFSTRRTLIDQNRNLRAENLMLRSRTQRFAALERENYRLRELLDATPDLGEEVVVADILAIETSPSARQVVINKGSRHHVYVGQPIADAHGILGQVTQVSRFTSTAMLITDSRHALPVQINRSGLRAIAVGADESDRLYLSFVPTNADIEPGDLVISSGLDHRFPAGYPVGEVTSVDLDPGEPFAKIVVAPSAHVGRSREVLLVWPHPQGYDDVTASATPLVPNP